MAPPPGAPIIPNSAAAVVSMAPNKQTNLPSVCVWFVLFPIPLLTEILGGNEEEGPLAYSTLCASFPATPPSFTTTNSTTKFRIPAFTKYSPRPTSPQHQLATFHKLKKNIHTNTQYTHTHTQMTSSTFTNIIKINTNTTTNTFRLTFEVNFVISQTTHSNYHHQFYILPTL